MQSFPYAARNTLLGLLSVAALSGSSFAQVAGGAAAYQGNQTGRIGAENTERAKRMDQLPPNPNSMFVDASVLMNVKADEYVATFGINEEGSTLEEANAHMDGDIARLRAGLKGLGIGESDTYTDFVAQNKIYGYEISQDIAREKVTGFEVKKNLSIHYRDKGMLDNLISAAAQAHIFDLIKVDYVVKDIRAVHARLMDEASREVKAKAADYSRLFGVVYRQPPQVYFAKNSSYYPTEMYDNYTAFEAEDVATGYDRQKYVVQNARKNRTFYFNPLNAKEFDRVVNPVVIEPVVQFTLYLKVLYNTGPTPPVSKHVPMKRKRRRA
jgi:uncharacterized protein YggE